MTRPGEPNEQSGFHTTEIELRCRNGHQWVAPGFSEWGGTWLYDENQAQCPTCGAWDGDEESADESEQAESDPMDGDGVEPPE